MPSAKASTQETVLAILAKQGTTHTDALRRSSGLTAVQLSNALTNLKKAGKITSSGPNGDRVHDIKDWAEPKTKAKKAKVVKTPKRKAVKATKDNPFRLDRALPEPKPGPFSLALAMAAIKEEPAQVNYVRAIATADGGCLVLNGDQLIHELEADAARAVRGLA